MCPMLQGSSRARTFGDRPPSRCALLWARFACGVGIRESGENLRQNGAKVGGPDFHQLEPPVGVVRPSGGADESRMIHSVNDLHPRRPLTTA